MKHLRGLEQRVSILLPTDGWRVDALQRVTQPDSRPRPVSCRTRTARRQCRRRGSHTCPGEASTLTAGTFAKRQRRQ